jgi:hypothetical protein
VFIIVGFVGLTLNAHAQDSKVETQTYTGEITRIDKKSKTITIKGPAGGLVPQSATSPRGRGAGSSAPAGGRRGSRGTAGAATPHGPDTRPFEDVETKIGFTDKTTVESSDGELKVSDLKIGDYVLVDTTREGKKIRAVKIKRTTAAEG